MDVPPSKKPHLCGRRGATFLHTLRAGACSPAAVCSVNPLAELLPSFPNGMGNSQEMIELYN